MAAPRAAGEAAFLEQNAADEREITMDTSRPATTYPPWEAEGKSTRR